MIKRPTWILLGVLVLVIGAYFLFEKLPTKANQPAATATTTPYLITKADGILQSLEIRDAQGHYFRMQRDPANNWVITAPSTGAADQGAASAAETQVGALQILNTLQVPDDLSTLQLASPLDTINLTFTSGVNHKIEVGMLTPTSSGYYVRLEGGDIYVISKYGLDSLLKLATNPPFPATATPAPTEIPSETPTETPAPATETLLQPTITP